MSLEGFGSHCFWGAEAEKYLVAEGLALSDLTDPMWVHDIRKADQIAAAVLKWGVAHGASNFCHWFQPMASTARHGHSGQVQHSMFEFDENKVRERERERERKQTRRFAIPAPEPRLPAPRLLAAPPPGGKARESGRTGTQELLELPPVHHTAGWTTVRLLTSSDGGAETDPGPRFPPSAASPALGGHNVRHVLLDVMVRLER